MKASEFEEKEYEHPLGTQLQADNIELWTPGQVLEKHVGFDRGLLLTAEYIWTCHGFSRPLSGVVPSTVYWPFLPQFRKRQHRLPSFRLNCFVQVKRCFIGRRLPKKLAELGSKRPFYRFDINQDQQAVLSASASALKNRALFIYAAPVFGNCRQLFYFQRTGQLVEHSTFPSVLSMNGHRAWYYNEPGFIGIANQGYELVTGPTLGERIASIIGNARASLEGAPSENLVSLASTLKQVVLDPVEGIDSARGAYLADDWRNIQRYAEEFELPPIGRAFLEVAAFSQRFDIEWFVLDDAPSSE